MKILFADTAHPSLKEKLSAVGHICDDLGDYLPMQLPEILSRYDGVVIRSRFRFDRELLIQLPALRFIARVGAGMENIDVEFANSVGIQCLHAPEGNRNAVAEHALGMLLSMLNNLCRADREVREGKWFREANRGEELDGRTVGIIGLGNTGSSFAKKLRGFDTEVLAYDPYVQSAGDCGARLCRMEEIFENADVVSLHVPLTTETQAMVNLAWLNKFSKPIRLINTARGKCLVTKDLLDAIETGKVLSAALDVLEFESLSFENFQAEGTILERLRQNPKILFTPHIAGWTHESNRKMAEILFAKITAQFDRDSS
jgi:D-3-phosphoglycerate dehydrogenase